jgi:cell division protein FtsQ
MKGRMTPRRLSWLGWFMGRVWFFSKIAAGIALVIGLFVWVLGQGYMKQAGGWMHDKIVAGTGSMGLRVADVQIEGRHYIDAETLRKSIQINPGDALLGVNIHDLHARLTALPWVKDVSVRRAWPDRVIITLDERLPVAIWRDAPGGAAVIDVDGVILSRDFAAYGTLLLVEGPGAQKEAGKLIALLKGQPDIAVRVKKAVRISERRWDLAMDGGTILRLPEDDPGFALARASKAQAQEKILDKGLKAVDLRQNDRIILENATSGTSDLLLKDGNPV